MDIITYKLFELTYEEVEIIDPQIGKIISKEDYLSASGRIDPVLQSPKSSTFTLTES